MIKQKSHSGAKKRFRATKTGLIKRNKQNKNHILTKKDTKRKRRLRQGGYVNDTQSATVKKLLPYD
ncbi:MAG TPA: 50S ribosomal protein L35 [Eubacteriales bacterium]|jgi:large subunit ribosomal protein L35|nr:50S ribosomal protein L35 [Eubacteriales bacterium]HRU84523.1 50S ribosomal protein L35 [Eubacteriales bacterium]